MRIYNNYILTVALLLLVTTPILVASNFTSPLTPINISLCRIKFEGE